MNRASFTLGLLASTAPLPAFARTQSFFLDGIASIEARTGGRLGVTAIDTGTQVAFAYRADERFPMCSTFKALAVAAVLERIDRGIERADRRVSYGRSDLLDYAPVARAHVARGFMTVEDLCAAAMTDSDNTAANLLLRTLGGPAGVTRFARSIGDRMTRLDHTEPALNFDVTGDPRDTTTPAAMAQSLRAVALGAVLTVARRNRYTAWLRGNKTGAARIRAGLPSTWRVGDKTGTGGDTNRFGDSETRNDIGILWPPGRAPIVLTVYLRGAQIAAGPADAAIAAVARFISARVR